MVLSACETAQGQIDYGEGVSGLVRALHGRGSSVLVTLQPVGDVSAGAFMERFYYHWLNQTGHTDPAAALRATQLEYLQPSNGAPTTRPIWTSSSSSGDKERKNEPPAAAPHYLHRPC